MRAAARTRRATAGGDVAVAVVVADAVAGIVRAIKRRAKPLWTALRRLRTKVSSSRTM